MIKYPPKPGVFLLCDFKGFIEPEMTKKRPVIVISTPTLHGEGNRLATIVPLSTTAPNPIREYHFQIKDMPLIPYYDSPIAWVKCDMVYTVSFDRLSLFYRGKLPNGKRNYIYESVSDEDLKHIKECVAKGVGAR